MRSRDGGHAGRGQRRMTVLGSALRRLFGFAALWVLFTQDLHEASLYGLVVVTLSTLVSLLLLPPGPRVWSLVGWAALIPALVWEAILSGTDVALRALRPGMPLKPALIRLPVHEHAQVATALAYVVTMLPGSLAVRLQSGELLLHVLDARGRPERTVRRMQQRLERALLDREGQGNG